MEKAAAKTTPTAEARAKSADEPQQNGPERHPLLRLQSNLGNQAVQQFLNGRMRAQSAATGPSDAQKQTTASTSVDVRKPQAPGACGCSGGCSKCQSAQDSVPGLNLSKATTKLASSSSLAQGAAPTAVQEVLRSPGKPLDRPTRTLMESRFGHDLSHVRLHTNAKAAESARAVNAQAFTVGRHMVFGAGKYAPGTADGKQLLAHELTHTLQQRNATPSSSALPVSSPNDSHEVQADRIARGRRDGAAAPVSVAPTGLQIAREPEPGKPAVAGTPHQRLDTAMKLLGMWGDTSTTITYLYQQKIQLEFRRGSGSFYDSKARKIVLDADTSGPQMAQALAFETIRIRREARQHDIRVDLRIRQQQILEYRGMPYDPAWEKMYEPKDQAEYVADKISRIAEATSDVIEFNRGLRGQGVATSPAPLESIYNSVYELEYKKVYGVELVGSQSENWADNEARRKASRVGREAVLQAIKSGQLLTADTHEKYSDYLAKEWERKPAEDAAAKKEELARIEAQNKAEAERKARVEEPVPGDAAWDSEQTPQWKRDEVDLVRQQFSRLRPEPAPVDTPPPADVGCHTDPYKKKKGESSACTGGRKKEDEATRATKKLLQPDVLKKDDGPLERARAERRAKLDRLNEAFHHWQKTKQFIRLDEFSQYEIEKDNVIPVEKRWDTYNRKEPNNLETADFNERFFRSKKEYEDERNRRHQEYLTGVSGCGSTRPSHIDCQKLVMAEYYPVRYGLREAALQRQYNDMQTAMPVLTQQGPLTAFAFHVAHEWFGWDTQKSASFAGLVGGIGNIAGAKIQKNAMQRQSGGGSFDPPGLDPHPANVAPAPTKEPIPKPDLPGKSTPGGGVFSQPTPGVTIPPKRFDPTAAAVDVKAAMTLRVLGTTASNQNAVVPTDIQNARQKKDAKALSSQSQRQIVPVASTGTGNAKVVINTTANDPWDVGSSVTTAVKKGSTRDPGTPLSGTVTTNSGSLPSRTDKTSTANQPPRVDVNARTRVPKVDIANTNAPTEPPPVPLRKQLREKLEADVNEVNKSIAELSAAKGRVQRQLASIIDRLKTATEEERDRLVEVREKLKTYQKEKLGSGMDLGQDLLVAKELLRGNERTYFLALTKAATQKTAYVSVKNRKVDEVFKTAATDLEVEHVYPRSKIWNLPGFVEKLTWKQQIGVFNYAKNLKSMPAKANLARSNTPYKSLPRTIWSKFTSDESVITNLSRLEDEVQRDIENMIKDPSTIPITE